MYDEHAVRYEYVCKLTRSMRMNMYDNQRTRSMGMNMYKNQRTRSMVCICMTINEHAAYALCSGELPVTLYSVSI